MRRNPAPPVLLVCAAFACAAGLVAQGGVAPTPSLLPPAWLQTFAVHAGTAQHLRVPPTPAPHAAVDVVLGGRLVTLDLAPVELRAPGFAMFARTANGLLALPAGSADTWRGTVLGDAASAVAATLTGGSLRAYVREGSGQLWVVQPLRDAFPAAAAATHVVFRGGDCAPLPGRCGVAAAAVAVPPAGGEDVQYVCELALEADYALFQYHGGSATAVQADVLGIVNAVDLIFDHDVQVHFQVTQLIVDSAPDPYTSSNANTLLAELRTNWNNNQGGVARDVAHLFSGRAIGAASGGTIGIAYVGTVCNLASAYGLSETHWTTNYAYRVAVTAHEFGHNFNAVHCDGQAACSLMCSVVGGCAGNSGAFSAGEQQQIVAYRATATCLAAQATLPAIASASPASFATVHPPLVTLNGSGFIGTTVVQVGPQQLTSGFQVLSDAQLRLTPPAGLPLGNHAVTVTNPAGTSNASPLLYTASNPCEVVVPSATYGGAMFEWRMGGWPNDAAFLLIGWSNATAPWLGQQLLNGYLLVWNGSLDQQGLATLAVTVPSGLLTGFTVYSQLVDIDPVTATLRSVSTIPGSWIVF